MKGSSQNENIEMNLVSRAQSGDTEAYGRLVEIYRKRAYHTALGLLGNHDDAWDVSQDAFMRSWRHIDQFRPDEPFYPWFYQILRRLCLNRLKQQNRHRPAETPAGMEPGISDARHDPAAIAELNDTKATVWRAVSDLPAKQKEVIILRHFQELSYKEMADLLLVRKGTIMSRLYYAREALRKELNGILD